MSTLSETFNAPHIEILLDGTQAKFARVNMGDWSRIAEEIRASRAASAIRRINAANIDVMAKAKAVRQAEAEFVSLFEAIDVRRTSIDGIRKTLDEQLNAGGTSDPVERSRIVSLIHPLRQAAIADAIIMLPGSEPAPKTESGSVAAENPTGETSTPSSEPQASTPQA